MFPLINLIINIIVLAHIVGIIYHFVALCEIQFWDENHTWLHIRQLDQSNWPDRYVQAYYWAVSTMVTILLYIPETNTETIFAVISIFIMTGVFGYSLNTIGGLVTELNKKTKEQENIRQMAYRFFKQRQLPEKLRDRITLYLDFIFQEDQTKNSEEEQIILNQLSNQLKHEVLRQINQRYVGYFEFLMKSFSQESQDKMLQIISEEQYSPDEYLTDSNQDNQDQYSYNLYIIVKGKLELYYQKDKSSEQIHIKKLKENNMIGLESFLTGQKISFQAKSLESCLLLKINRDKFLEIIYNNNDDLELFRMMQDQFYQSQTSQNVKNDCLLCHREHSFQNCNETNLQIDKHQIIYNFKHFDAQLRQNWQRIRKLKTIKCLLYLPELEDCVYQIFDDYNEDDEIRDLALAWKKFYKYQYSNHTGNQVILNDEIIQEYQKTLTTTKSYKDNNQGISKGYSKGYSKGNTNFRYDTMQTSNMMFVNAMNNTINNQGIMNQTLGQNIGQFRRSSVMDHDPQKYNYQQNKTQRNSIFKQQQLQQNRRQSIQQQQQNRRASIQQLNIQRIQQKKGSESYNAINNISHNQQEQSIIIEPIVDNGESTSQDTSSNNINSPTGKYTRTLKLARNPSEKRSKNQVQFIDKNNHNSNNGTITKLDQQYNSNKQIGTQPNLNNSFNQQPDLSILNKSIHRIVEEYPENILEDNESRDIRTNKYRNSLQSVQHTIINTQKNENTQPVISQNFIQNQQGSNTTNNLLSNNHIHSNQNNGVNPLYENDNTQHNQIDNTANLLERELELQNLRLKQQNMNDWDLKTFDKPKNYLIYMPYNNLHTLVKEGIGLQNIIEQKQNEKEQEIEQSSVSLKGKEKIYNEIVKIKEKQQQQQQATSKLQIITQNTFTQISNIDDKSAPKSIGTHNKRFSYAPQSNNFMNKFKGGQKNQNNSKIQSQNQTQLLSFTNDFSVNDQSINNMIEQNKQQSSIIKHSNQLQEQLINQQQLYTNR